MARTKVSEATADKLVNRLSLLMLKEQNGSEEQANTANIQLAAIRWTLRTVGFSDDIVDDLIAQAGQLAE